MNKDAALYDLTQSTQGMVFRAALQRYQANTSEEERDAQPPAPPLLQIRAGYAESPGWMLVQAMEFDPEPLSVERFRRRAVYSAPNLTLALLELLASEKWLDRRGSDYHLTEAGRDIMTRRQRRGSNLFATFEPIPADDIRHLADLLGRVIDTSLEAIAPPGTWSLAHSRNRAPAEDAAPLVHIIQYCSDLNAFRDDSHMAAYGAYDVPGHIWEAFAFIATEQANNAADLYDQLAYRGFYTEDWRAALDDLSGRGWIAAADAEYALTDEGQSVREAVEQATDRYFYQPWNVLSDGEFTAFVTLLQTLHDTCQQMVDSS